MIAARSTEMPGIRKSPARTAARTKTSAGEFPPVFVSRYTTGLGEGAVAVTEQGIFRIWLPPGEERQNIETIPDQGVFAENGLSRSAARFMERYFSGERIEPDFPVDLSGMTPFRECILRETMAISYGMITSYAELARLADHPGAARAVGGALASNRAPVIIPCHRVVAADGRLTGFSAPGGITLKKYLLSMEGVEFRGETARLNIDSYKQAELA